MAEELGRRETEFAMKRPELERRRLAAIVTAQAALAAYEKELAPPPGRAGAQEGRGDRQARGRPENYEAATLAKKMAEWEKSKAASIVNRWRSSIPRPLTATNKRDPDQGAGRLDHRLRAQHEWRRHDRRRDRADRDHRPAARGP